MMANMDAEELATVRDNDVDLSEHVIVPDQSKIPHNSSYKYPCPVYTTSMPPGAVCTWPTWKKFKSRKIERKIAFIIDVYKRDVISRNSHKIWVLKLNLK